MILHQWSRSTLPRASHTIIIIHLHPRVPFYSSYLRCDTQHLEGRWHVEVLGNADVAKINPKSLAPDTQPVNVKDGQIAGQGQDECLGVVAPERILFTVLVGHFDAHLAGFGSRADPEKSVWRMINSFELIATLSFCKSFLRLTWSCAVVGEVGHEESLSIDDVDTVGAHLVDARQGAEPLRPWVVESLRDPHFSKVILGTKQQLVFQR